MARHRHSLSAGMYTWTEKILSGSFDLLRFFCVFMGFADLIIVTSVPLLVLVLVYVLL